MYWLIQNDGECPIQGMTLLGLSTSRGKEEKIGQFGTGCKHAINILLRMGLTPIIYTGETRIQFFAKPETLENGHTYNQVYYSIDGKDHPTSMTLEFGGLDWDSVQMALRELLSNAIDAGNPKFLQTSEITFDTGTTRIYLQQTPEINKYFLNIGEYFLYFSTRDDKDQSVLKKRKAGAARFYRKGVFVREIKTDLPSLYDYNLNDMKIDECRNMDDYSVKHSMSNEISKNIDIITEIIQKLVSGDDKYVECQTGYKYSNWPQKQILKIWNTLCPGCCMAAPDEILYASDKGFDLSKIKVINSKAWIEILKDSGVKTVIQKYVDSFSSQGDEIVSLREETVNVFNDVWSKLESIKATNGKAKPELKNFRHLKSEDGPNTHKFGYYDRITKTVFINVDNAGSVNTMLEECIHHISGHSDMSRGFQEFTIELISRLMFN
jgi:hypothetical protein